LTDDVVWELHGYTTVTGKDAFDREIENEATVGPPKLTIDRRVEEGDTVVAVGSGEVAQRSGISSGSSSVTSSVSLATRSAASRPTR
jgi:hypothetical protein